MGIVPGVGGCQTFVSVFWGVIPYGGEKAHERNPRKNPGTNPLKMLFMCFLSSFLFAPNFLDVAFLLTIGSFLLTVELFFLSLLLAIGAFLRTVGAFFLTAGKCL